MYIPFEQLPDQARIWIYSADRALSPSEQDHISQCLTSFAQAWQSHQIDVKASFLIKNDRFLIIGSDDSDHGISGCGIDKSVHQIQELEKTLHVKLLDKSFVYFELDEQLVSVPFVEIKKQVAAGRIFASSPFFNTLITHKGQLEELFRIPSKEGWVKKYLSESLIA